MEASSVSRTLAANALLNTSLREILLPPTPVAISDEYQRDWQKDMSSIVPALSSINASDYQHTLVLHQMNNHSSIATEAGPDVTEMNAMIMMELEDAKKAMSNVTDSGQPDLGSHNVGNYLTSVPLATMDHYDNVGSEYQGVEDDDGAMALRGGGGRQRRRQ